MQSLIAVTGFSAAILALLLWRLASDLAQQTGACSLCQLPHPLLNGVITCVFAGHKGAWQRWRCKSKVQEKPAALLPGGFSALDPLYIRSCVTIAGSSALHLHTRENMFNTGMSEEHGVFLLL